MRRLRYFDASALVKRYVHAEGSARVSLLLRESRPATSRLSEAEISSTLARRVRDGTLAPAARAKALDVLSDDLRRMHVVELAPAVVGAVHDLLARHGLRAADALHLASALALSARTGRLEFVAFDLALAQAARAEGLHVLP